MSQKFEHTQKKPKAIWVINHNLNDYPNIIILGEFKNEIKADNIWHMDKNRVQLTFLGPIKGSAYLS